MKGIIQSSYLTRVLFASALCALHAAPATGQETQPRPRAATGRCMITVGTQTTEVSADNSFRISNVTAADNFGSGGPGTAPDSVSDDKLRAHGVCVGWERPLYVLSNCFRIRNDETTRIGVFQVSGIPPVSALSLKANPEDLQLAPGESSRMNVQASLSDGTTVPVDPAQATSCLSFRTSNKGVAQIDQFGNITADRPGDVYLTTISDAGTTVSKIEVRLPEVQTTVEGYVWGPDGKPFAGAEVSTTAFGGGDETDTEGFFSFSLSLPPNSSVTATVTATDGAIPLTGRSETVEVIVDGFTDVGVVKLSAPEIGKLFDSAVWGGGVEGRDIAVADMDLDGHLDAVTNNNYPAGIRIFYGDGQGYVRGERNITFSDYVPPEAIAVGNLNGDGRPDIAIGAANINDPVLGVILSDGDTYADPVFYVLDRFSNDLAIADLDGDNRDDIVFVAYDNFFSIYMNIGDGTLAEPVSRPFAFSQGLNAECNGCNTCADCTQLQDLCEANKSVHACESCGFNDRVEARALAVDDMDGDGNLDIVIATGQSFIDLFYGLGGGAFAGPLEFRTNPCSGQGRGTPESLAVADLNGDDLPDIVVSDGPNNYRSQSFSVMLNNGDRTFAAPTSHFGGPTTGKIAVGDLDGDGDAEVVTVNPGGFGTIGVTEGHGDGTFGETALYGGGSEQNAVRLADFDEDGALDIMYSSRNSSDIRVLFNNGRGEFSPLIVPIAFDYPVEELAVADFDGDGRVDVAIVDPNGQLFDEPSNTYLSRVYIGYSSIQAVVWYWVPLRAYSIVAANLGGSDLPDIAVACRDANSMAVLINEGDTTFADFVEYPISATEPQAINAADLDGNGSIDLAVASYVLDEDVSSDGGVSVFLNNADGTFGAEAVYRVHDAPYAIILEDFDRSGLPDILTANQRSGDVSVLLNNGDGTFPTDRGLEFEVEADPYDATSADFNGDGNPDVATVHRCRSDGEVPVLFGTGFGTLVNRMDYDTGDCPISITAADLDADGDSDVVLGTDTARMLLLINQGDGTFVQDPLSYPVGRFPYDITTADADGDGDLDVIMINIDALFEQGGVTIQLNRLIP